MKTLVVLIALVAIPTALSIECYECDECRDSKGTERDCGPGYDQCAQFHVESETNYRTIRYCANDVKCKTAKSECENTRRTDANALCEAACCDSDLCNAGAAPSFSVLLVSLCSLLAVGLLSK